MANLMDLDALDQVKPHIKGFVSDTKKEHQDLDYIDIRCELIRFKSASANCGAARNLIEDTVFSLGIKVIAGKRAKSTGYFGEVLGKNDLVSFSDVLKNGFQIAYQRALASADKKSHIRKMFGSIASSLVDAVMAPVEIVEDTIHTPYDKDPSSVTMKQILDMVEDTSRAIQAFSPQIRFNHTYVGTQKVRELFASSEGTLLDHTYALTEGSVYVVAGDIGEDQWDIMGDRRGFEVLEGKNSFGKTYRDFALSLADDTVHLSMAPSLNCDPKKEVTVVTDPHYNALLVHEICGHPTEADRVLKMETAYAGRSWFFRSFDDNEIGKQVASKSISVYSDPTISGYGGYPYDSEGVRAIKVALIENGILKDFMHSRETAHLLKKTPNGCSRAVNASYVPIVRMTNVVFGNGDTPPQKLIEEVEDGYYLKSHRTPSISESRENFRITCRKVYKIEKGKLTQLYRNGGMTSDSKDYLMSVDGVGNDFLNFSISNCGKGSPMQLMRVGNGGPTLRGRAKLTGGSNGTYRGGRR